MKAITHKEKEAHRARPKKRPILYHSSPRAMCLGVIENRFSDSAQPQKADIAPAKRGLGVWSIPPPSCAKNKQTTKTPRSNYCAPGRLSYSITLRRSLSRRRQLRPHPRAGQRPCAGALHRSAFRGRCSRKVCRPDCLPRRPVSASRRWSLAQT